MTTVGAGLWGKNIMCSVEKNVQMFWTLDSLFTLGVSPVMHFFCRTNLGKVCDKARMLFVLKAKP